MFNERIKEISIGIFLIAIALVIVCLCIENTIFLVKHRTIEFKEIIIFTLTLISVPFSFSALTVGYKLIRYKSSIKKSLYEIEETVRKNYKMHIIEELLESNMIILSGLDGTGKSTHARLLKIYLEKKNIKTRVVWARWTSFISFFFYLYAHIFHRTIKLKVNRTRTIKVRVFYIDKALRKLYPVSIILDFLWYYLILRLYHMVTNTHILIFDRFALDLIIDIFWETRESSFLKNLLSRVLIREMQKGCMIIFTAEIPVILNRKKSDFLSLKEIMFKFRAFELFAQYFNIPVIDTSNNSVALTFRELINSLKLPYKF